ncbi:MAG: hypothetical protein Q8M15_02740 [Bacteroidota bacterium]|nr:hypothetical protein [Bacteroidota bacterium]
MKTNIDKEFIKNNLPYFAFYRMPTGLLRCIFSDTFDEEMEIVEAVFFARPEIMKAFESAIKVAKKTKIKMKN